MWTIPQMLVGNPVENSINVSSKDTDEERKVHSKGDNTEIMNHYKADEAVRKLCESLF